MKCIYRNPFIKSIVFQNKEPVGSGSNGETEIERRIQHIAGNNPSFNPDLERSLPITLQLNRLDRLLEQMAYDETRDLIEDLVRNERISPELAEDYRRRLGDNPSWAREYFIDLQTIKNVYYFLENSSWSGGISPVTPERAREMKESMKQNPGVARVFLDEIRHLAAAQDLPDNPYQQN